MYRLAKQITSATVALLLVTAVVVLSWMLRSPEPTCSDGIKNQDEEDIDCGGICGSCFAIPQDARVSGETVISNPGGRVDVAFTVQNLNPQWGTVHLPYTVEVLDASGRTLATRTGETFLLPQEEHIVVEQAIDASGEGLRAVVTTGETEWVMPPAQAPRTTNLSVLNQTFTRNPDQFTGAEVRAVIRNDSPYSYDAVQVHVLVRDRATGNVVGARRTEMRTLRAAERREFVVAWSQPLPLTGEAELVIVPLTNVFIDENFIREYGNLEDFQSFSR
jgi:hypothetical protein